MAEYLPSLQPPQEYYGEAMMQQMEGRKASMSTEQYSSEIKEGQTEIVVYQDSFAPGKYPVDLFLSSKILG